MRHRSKVHLWRIQYLLQRPEAVALVFLCALMLFLVIGTESFGSLQNLHNVSRNSAFIACMALGQTLVIISGGIDLSVGSVMGLSGVVTALALERGASLPLGLLAGLGSALICGLVNGLIVVRFRLSPFVATLAMLAAARSVAMVLSSNRMFDQFGPAQESFFSLTAGNFLGLPAPILLVIILSALVALGLHTTPWGRYVLAIGGNEGAARLVGIKVDRVKVSVYALSALTAGCSAVLSVGWLGSASAALGNGYELIVIAASVVGGTSLAGGRGGVLGALVGAMLLEVIRNGLLLIGVDPYWQGALVGLLLIAAGSLGSLSRERAA